MARKRKQSVAESSKRSHGHSRSQNRRKPAVRQENPGIRKRPERLEMQRNPGRLSRQKTLDWQRNPGRLNRQKKLGWQRNPGSRK